MYLNFFFHQVYAFADYGNNAYLNKRRFKKISSLKVMSP
jgi:hypothetical protein